MDRILARIIGSTPISTDGSENDGEGDAFMEMNLAGRLRNTHLPVSRPLLPLYEALFNSFHAVDDGGDDEREIEIVVHRGHAQANMEEKQGTVREDPVVGFTVTDSGIGFDDDNMTSFKTADSDYKINRGGKGIGRLMWLKGFEEG